MERTFDDAAHGATGPRIEQDARETGPVPRAERGTGVDRSRGRENIGQTERVLSLLGGAALALYGLQRRGAGGAALAATGAALLDRGATGHCRVLGALGVDRSDRDGHWLKQQHGRSAVLDASKSVRVERSVIVNRPREELYRFWRNFENLPHIMEHLDAVTMIDERRSRWRAKAPAGQSAEWEAVIHNEVENELIAWRTTDDASVPNAGSVRFTPAPGGRGTEVRVVLEYDPPGGRLGAAVAKLFGEEPDMQVRADLRRFKQRMEAGVLPTAPERA